MTFKDTLKKYFAELKSLDGVDHSCIVHYDETNFQHRIADKQPVKRNPRGAVQLHSATFLSIIQ